MAGIDVLWSRCKGAMMGIAERATKALDLATGARVEAPMPPASFQSGKRWYCIYTNIRCEFRAAGGIRAAGFDVLLPTYKAKLKRNRRLHEVIRPVFSRYLFVAFDINRDPWHSIRECDGVERLICYPRMTEEGDHIPIPASIPERAMRMICDAQDNGWGLAETDGVIAYFEKGEHVRICDGPFWGFNAVIVSLLKDFRAKAEVNLFGRKTPVEFDLAQLAKV